jgi:predicted outer membrane repeat protein
VTINGSTLSGNSADVDGGGIYNSGALTVTNSIILGNTAPFGADVFLAGGTLTNNNSTIGVIGP